MKPRYVLGIETTCDETSIGIFDQQENLMLANETCSSAQIHAKYGGVVPELAARKHEESINQVFNAALAKANLAPNQIDLIGFSAKPGLPGCLFVGKVFAEFLHFFLKKSMIGINHLYAHVFSGEIDQPLVKFPALGMVISGGHTVFYLLKSYAKVQMLNQTSDDAVGEVYDKVGRALKLVYPAGPKIDRLFNNQLVNEKIFNFTFKQHRRISFSGLKTAVITYINQVKPCGKQVAVVASTFQQIIMQMVLYFVRKYIGLYPEIKTVLVGGGVSANAYLREGLKRLCDAVLLPEHQYTGDNGGMVAYYTARVWTEQQK